MPGTNPEPAGREADLSRRQFLQYAGQTTVVLSGASLLAACGSTASSSSGSSSNAAAGTPKKGGTLRIGVTGGGPSDTIDAHAGLLNSDFARNLSLYEPLVAYDLDAKVTMVLAESFEPDKTGKLWTVKLKPNVHFHDGTPLTADDVIFSINRIIKQKTPGLFALALIDAPAMKKVDTLTVQIPMKTAYPQFPEYLASLYWNQLIVPPSYNPKKPVGTGPFKFQSFTPGQTSTFVRNDNYWQKGGPYVDTLVITDYSDENAQINALLSKQADGIGLLSAASLPRLQGGGARPIVAETGVNTAFTMRVDTAPFNDVRVRQAMRLMVNRPSMLNVVYGGRGSLGNDIFSPLDPEYDHSLPQRVQDIAQAKSLLKAAGRENLSVALATSEIFAGTLSAAQVFAQQASAAGVSIKLNQLTTTNFFNNFLKWPFAQTFWYYTPYLAQIQQELLSNSPFNETHWSDPHYASLYKQAFSTTSASTRTQIAHELQAIDHTSGGLIIPYFLPIIDGVATNVHGVAPGKVGFSFGNFSFKDMWLA